LLKSHTFKTKSHTLLLSQLNEDEKFMEVFKSEIRKEIKSSISDSKELEPEEIDLNDFYIKNKEDYVLWVMNLEVSNSRKRKILSDLNKIFANDVKTILDIKKLISKFSKGIKINSSFRNFIKYLDESGRFKLNVILNFNSQIKGTTYSGIDSYIPNDQKVIESLSNIFKFSTKLEYIIYKLCVLSGCRFTEIEYLIKNFNEDLIEMKDNCIIYDLGFKRAQKKAFYLYFHNDIFNEFVVNLKEIKKLNLDRLSWKIKRRIKFSGIDVIDLKYYRKYLRTKLVEFGANSELADYISGRESASVGFRNYQEKKYAGLREYLKVYDLYVNLFNEVEK